MGPIDPHQLLKALDPLLGQNGAIKGPNEAARVASLMKDVGKLVSKCIYINILKSTDATDTLTKFIEVGGWNTLNQWLLDCKDMDNTPVLIEMLKVYQKLPITVDLLKKNNTAKTIRQLGKSDSEVLKNLSKEIVEQWTKKVREKSNNDSVESTDKKKKNEKKDKEKDREKERDKDKERERDKEKDRDRNKEKYKNKKEEKSENKQIKNKNTDSDMDTSSSVSSSKKPLEPECTGIVTHGNGLKIRIKMERKDPNKGDTDSDNTEKKRAPTVKRPNTKFRSTGLEDDSLTSKQKESPNDANKTNSKRSGSESVVKEEPPEKKSRLNIFTQLASSVPNTTPPVSTPTTPSTPSPTTLSPAEVHTKLRITPPKAKPAVHKILDSSGFMDEMMKNDLRTPGVIKRKKKTPPASSVATTTTTTTTSSSSLSTPTLSKQPPTPSSPVSPTTAIIKSLPTVPSFYQDTLVTSEDKDTKPFGTEKTRSPSPPLLSPEVEWDSKNTDNDSANTSQDVEMKEPNTEIAMDSENYMLTKITVEETVPKGELKGLLIYSKAGKRTKKKVSWVEENTLRTFHYFEMDETERENVNRPKMQNFDEMKKQEMLLDRKAMESARRLTNDNMVEAMPWKRPPLIDGLENVVQYGSESIEKNIQKEREQHVLQAIFFNKDMLPDSPAEPDMESVEPSDPKFIPLEDENSEGEQYYFSHDTAHPDHPHQQNQQQQHPNNNFLTSVQQHQNLPPEVSNILASLQQPGNAVSAALQADAGNPVIASVQNILSTLMASGNDPHKTEEAVGKLREILDPQQQQHNMQAYGPGPNQMHPGAPHGMHMGPGPGFGPPGGPPQGMHGPPGGPGPGGPNMPRQGLLGTAPPGFPAMNQGPGPQGPPRFQQGPSGGPGNEWGGDMGPGMGMGPGPMMGRGGNRGGMPMRGGRMPMPGHMGQQGPPGNMGQQGPPGNMGQPGPPGNMGQQGPPQGHPGQQGPGGPMGPPQMQGGPPMGPGGQQMGPGGPGGPPMGPGGPRGPPRGPGGRGRGRGHKDRPLCRHFAAGGCRRGNTCSFLHPGENGPPV